MFIGLGLGLTAARGGGGAAPKITVLMLSQSEPAYVTESSAFYRALTPPALEAENLTVIATNGAKPTTKAVTITPVTSATRLTVNPAMVVLANALNHIAPGQQFGLAEASEAGTGRADLASDLDADREWSDTAAIVSEAEAAGFPIDRLTEFWYANDASTMPTWLASWAPLYYGQNADGSAFTLGSNNPGGTPIDHCIYDFESAGPSVKGRGLLARDVPFDIMRKGPWTDSELSRFQGLDTFVADGRFVALGGVYGTPAWAWYSDGHPIVDSPYGMYEAVYDFYMPSFLRAVGLPADESAFTSAVFASGGASVDVTATLANGGVLTTKRKVLGVADPVSPTEQWQEVAGFEIKRSGDSVSTPIRRLGATGATANYRGTVTLLDDATVRIVPEVAFGIGDAVTYGTASTDVQYNAELHALDLPIEHIAAYTNDAADYPFSGLNLRTRDAFTRELTPPAEFFTVTGTGPYFVDPANVPASTTRIRYVLQMRIPSAVASISGGRNVFTQENIGFDMLFTTNAGLTRFYLGNVKDGTGASVKPTVVDVLNATRDAWFTLEIYADQVANEVQWRLNEGSWNVMSFSATGNGAFQTGREISFFGGTTGLSLLHSGVQIGLAECYFTTSGTETLRKRIEGNAATVNADAWKLGTNAT